MNLRKAGPLVAAALVLGLVLGNVIGGFAAPARGTAPTGLAASCAGLGLRMGGAMRDAGGRLADVVAKLTGLDAEDVQAKRAEGESFSAIAKDKGVTSAAVVDEALKVRKQVLDAKVKDGTLTRQQADEAMAAMRTRLTERVDSTAAGCTGTGGGGCGMGGGYGRGSGGAGRGGGCGGCGQAPANQ